MRPGVASQTAVYVCMGRAAAHQSTLVPGFSDPTALLLLPEEARRRVEQLRGGQIPRGARERWRYELLKRRALMMAVRTVAIDAALRETPVEQLVILGAGLDGRAWRMPELRDATVFELDHPDSQRQKRSRVSALSQTAREIRFAAVDFTKDSLDDVLEKTGHDPKKPTVWIWEGVVMYLERAAIEASLTVISKRSAPKSRLLINYMAPALILPLIRIILRRVGEPVKSVIKPAEMRALLSPYGFTARDDQSLFELAPDLPSHAARALRVMSHLRIVVAERS